MKRIILALGLTGIVGVSLAGAFGYGMYLERLHADRQLNQMRLQFEGELDAAVAIARAQGQANDQQLTQYNFARGAYAWCVSQGGDSFECNEKVEPWAGDAWQLFTEGFIRR